MAPKRKIIAKKAAPQPAASTNLIAAADVPMVHAEHATLVAHALTAVLNHAAFTDLSTPLAVDEGASQATSFNNPPKPTHFK